MSTAVTASMSVDFPEPDGPVTRCPVRSTGVRCRPSKVPQLCTWISDRRNWPLYSLIVWHPQNLLIGGSDRGNVLRTENHPQHRGHLETSLAGGTGDDGVVPQLVPRRGELLPGGSLVGSSGTLVRKRGFENLVLADDGAFRRIRQHQRVAQMQQDHGVHEGQRMLSEQCPLVVVFLVPGLGVS